MKPLLSVIITTYNEEKNIRQCLDSLDRQDRDIQFEIIVVDSSQDNTAEIIRSEFGTVTLLHYKDRKYCGDARNLGIGKAQGGIIAFLDADCIAADDWLKQILQAHEEPHAVVGGTIANYNTKSLVSWGAYFCEFSRYMPDTPSGWLNEMAGANVSFKREIFQRFGPLIEGTYCSDSEFHYRLVHGNIRVMYQPAIQIVHHSIDRLSRFVRHEFSHGRSFAEIRVKYMKFSSLQRMAYPFIFFLLAIKLFTEITIRVLKNRIYLTQYLKSIPFLCLGLTVWCLGESFGYLGVKRDE